jgi:hypothetical protein
MSWVIIVLRSHASVEGVVNAFHVEMFHGRGRRQNAPQWGSCDHNPGDDLSDPIQYTCNAYNLPDVATRSLNFIVSSSAYEAIRDLPGLSFAKVELEKVIYLPYTPGDFSTMIVLTFFRIR